MNQSFNQAHVGMQIKTKDGRDFNILAVINETLALTDAGIVEVHEVQDLPEARLPRPTDKNQPKYYKVEWAAPHDLNEHIQRVNNATAVGIVYDALDYRNPFALSYMYYSEGQSLRDMATLFGCHHKTVMRWMNYYGYKRRTHSSAALVLHHGIVLAGMFGWVEYQKCFHEFYK
ncbi:hypothetical protein EG878_14670 [Enterococcus faecalis]|nr:hypothetical protein EG878_14670 [Enterococcus faecalis]